MQDSEYNAIVHYIESSKNDCPNRYPKNFTKNEERSLRRKCTNFQYIDGKLFKKSYHVSYTYYTMLISCI